MRNRLFLGYLSLTLVLLVAFGVPFGLLWAGQAKNDALHSLSSSASTASLLVSRPLSAGLVFSIDKGPDTDDGNSSSAVADVDVSDHPRLLMANRDAIEDNLRPFSGGRELGSVLYLGGDVLVRVGPAAALAPSVLSTASLERLRSGSTVTGTTTGAHSSMLFAAARVTGPRPRTLPNTDPRSSSTSTPIGIVLIAEKSSVVDARIRNIALGLLAVAIAALALAGLVGWVLLRSLVRPLAQIELAVERIGNGDMSARAPTDEGPPELIHLALVVNTMAAELTELVSAQQAFVTDASHQLRTPLTALRLRIENLAFDEGDDERTGILQELERLGRIVTGLLALARAEVSASRTYRVDLAPVVADRHAAWLDVATDHGVALSVDPLQPAWVWVVKDGLEQALDNLIDNAIRSAGHRGHVRLRIGIENGFVTLHVTDDGQGMGPADRLRAFDRFWSGRADSKAGSGLGLAIVAHLVRSSGGTVELLPADGGGLDAVVLLRAG